MEELLLDYPDRSTLFLGEGNFSLSRCLCRLWWKNRRNRGVLLGDLPATTTMSGLTATWRVVATCFELEAVSEAARDNMADLRSMGVSVLAGIDATRLDDPKTRHLISGASGGAIEAAPFFGRVIFMFPHTGGKMKILQNRNLLRDFAKGLAASGLLDPVDGKVIVALCAGQGGTPLDPVQRPCEADTWQVAKMMAYGGLELVGVGPFQMDHPDLGAYQSYGFRGWDRWFHADKGFLHVFQAAGWGPSAALADPSWSSEGICDLKRRYAQKKWEALRNPATPVGRVFRTLLGSLDLELPDGFILQDQQQQDDDADLASFLKGLEPSGSDPATLVFRLRFDLQDFSQGPLRPFLVVWGTPAVPEDLEQEARSGRTEDLHRVFDLLLICSVEARDSPSGSSAWQDLWRTRGPAPCPPPVYQHCLSFWLPDGVEKLDDRELATVLWTAGHEAVAKVEVIDVYKRDGSIANTLRLHYQSHFFPMSPKLVWDIQTDGIAQALCRIFAVRLK